MINGKQADLEKSEIGLHSTPTIVDDMIIVGSSMFEGLGYVYSTNVQGPRPRLRRPHRQADVARSTRMPGRGEFGHETWENGSWDWTGNTGVWTQITVDPEAGLVYLPVETPTIDEYGGNRPGDNLFAESLVAVDLKTGKRKWHFQFVHHPLWDHDMSSAPLLIDTTIDGKPRKLVAVPSKQGWLYMLRPHHRQPIWPIEERPVPQTHDARREDGARRSRSSTKPPPYSRTYVAESDLIDFTPELRKQALENLKQFRWEQTPVRAADRARVAEQARRDQHRQHRAAASTGRARGFDPETGIFYTQAGTTPRSPSATTTRKSSTRSTPSSSRTSRASRAGKPTRTTACRVAAPDGTAAGRPAASTSPAAKAAARWPRASTACRS